MPRQIVAKRYWSKKYPICIEFDDVDSGKGTSENNETKCLNAELEDETVDTETKLDDNDVKMTARDKLSKLKKRITHKGQKNSSKGVNQHQNPLYSALSTKTTTPTTLTKTITTTTTTTATSTKPPSSSKTTPKPSIAKPPSSRSSNLAPLTTVNPHSDPLSSCSDIMADVKEEEEEEDDDLKSNKTPFRLYLFSRTCREKEEWYRRSVFFFYVFLFIFLCTFFSLHFQFFLSALYLLSALCCLFHFSYKSTYIPHALNLYT